MIDITDDRRALDAAEPEDDHVQPEPWLWLYYDDRDDAFEAAQAAETLGLRWALVPEGFEPADDDFAARQWVVEIRPGHRLPESATSSIFHDVG